MGYLGKIRYVREKRRFELPIRVTVYPFERSETGRRIRIGDNK